MKANIVISNSQQSYNKCLMGDSEQDHCYQIAKKVAALLKFYDCKSCLVPNFSGTESEILTSIGNYSNSFVRQNAADMSYHLDIHTDGGYDGKGASGLYISEGGKCFIQKVYNAVSEITPWGDGGIALRNDLFILRFTDAIAGIIEISFHDKLTQARWLHQNLDLISLVVVKGIVGATGIKLKASLDSFDKIIDAATKAGTINSGEWWKKNAVYGKTIAGELVRQLVCSLKK